ncbi:MAG: glycosyltransferase, partial [Bdellovibrionota bacterium]
HLVDEISDTESWLATNVTAGDAIFKARTASDTTFVSRLLSLEIAEQPSLSDLPNLLRLRKMLKARGVDIVHGHGAKGGMYARLVSRMIGAKSVYSAHGGSLHDVFSPFKRRLFLCVEWVLSFLTDGLVFESSYTRERYFDLVRELPERAHLVPNGIRLPAVAVERPFGPCIQLAAFGMLRELKGHDILIGAVAILRSKGLNVEAHVYGEGPFRQSLEKQIREAKLEGVVVLEGETASPVEVMSKADIVVQPSRFESFGYTALEAMALGKAVVASKVGGLRELIDDGVDGVLVQRLEPEAFATALERLIKNPDVALNLGRKARTKAESYDSGRMAETISKIYRELLGER